jgi:hypothetical protein
VTLDSTVYDWIVYQQLIDKIYKSQPTLIPNLFEGTVHTWNQRLISIERHFGKLSNSYPEGQAVKIH